MCVYMYMYVCMYIYIYIYIIPFLRPPVGAPASRRRPEAVPPGPLTGGGAGDWGKNWCDMMCYGR